MHLALKVEVEICLLLSLQYCRGVLVIAYSILVIVGQCLHIVFCLTLSVFSFPCQWEAKMLQHIRFKTRWDICPLGSPSPLAAFAPFALPLDPFKRAEHRG